LSFFIGLPKKENSYEDVFVASDISKMQNT